MDVSCRSHGIISVTVPLPAAYISSKARYALCRMLMGCSVGGKAGPDDSPSHLAFPLAGNEIQAPTAPSLPLLSASSVASSRGLPHHPYDPTRGPSRVLRRGSRTLAPGKAPPRGLQQPPDRDAWSRRPSPHASPRLSPAASVNVPRWSAPVPLRRDGPAGKPAAGPRGDQPAGAEAPAGRTRGPPGAAGRPRASPGPLRARSAGPQVAAGAPRRRRPRPRPGRASARVS